MFQQNYQEESTYEFQEPTLRRESTEKRENLSGESHDGGEEFQPEESEDDADARKDFWSIQGYFIYCHQIEPRVQLTCREKNHSLFHKIYIIERNSSEKKYAMRGVVVVIGEKSKHLRQKQIQLC